MAIELKMPALSPTMEEGTLAKWLVKEGDDVKSGDILAEIETDKATMEFEAVDEGKIAKILVPEGTDGVKVGTADRSARWRWRAGGRTGCRASRRHQEQPKPASTEEPSIPAAASQQDEADADAARLRDRRARPRRRCCRDPRRPRSARRHAAGQHDRARRAARRDGGGDAARRAGLRDGRGGRRVSGRLQGHAEPAAGIRRQARRRHADHRIWLCRARHWRGDGRAPADRRVHDLQLRDAGDRPHHQFGRQDQLHVGRPDALPDRVPRAQRRGGARRRPAQPELRQLVRARAGPDRDLPVQRGRRQGPAQGRDPHRRPGRVPRERAALRPAFRCSADRRLRAADRQGARSSGRART